MKNFRKLSKIEMRKIGGGQEKVCNPGIECIIQHNFGTTLGSCYSLEGICGCHGIDAAGNEYFGADLSCTTGS